jgi:hypothetical protein
MSGALTLDAGTVMSLMPFMSTTRRLFDPFKEPEKLREEYRVNYAINRDVESANVERDSRDRTMRETAVGRSGYRAAPTVGETAPEGSQKLALTVPTMLRA